MRGGTASGTVPGFKEFEEDCPDDRHQILGYGVNNGQWHTSGAGYGLKVSVTDRDRFFRRGWNSVMLRLVADSGFVDVAVNCAKESFWHGTCRELISRDIGCWFFDLGLAPWPKGRPPRFDLSLIEPGVFRVEPHVKPT